MQNPQTSSPSRMNGQSELMNSSASAGSLLRPQHGLPPLAARGRPHFHPGQMDDSIQVKIKFWKIKKWTNRNSKSFSGSSQITQHTIPNHFFNQYSIRIFQINFFIIIYDWFSTETFLKLKWLFDSHLLRFISIFSFLDEDSYELRNFLTWVSKLAKSETCELNSRKEASGCTGSSVKIHSWREWVW